MNVHNCAYDPHDASRERQEREAPRYAVGARVTRTYPVPGDDRTCTRHGSVRRHLKFNGYDLYYVTWDDTGTTLGSYWERELRPEPSRCHRQGAETQH